MNFLLFTSHRFKQIKNTKLLISRAIACTAYSQCRLSTPIVNPSYSSDSLTLRPFKFSDARDLLNCVCDDQVTKFLDVETMTTEAEALDFITNDLMMEPCWNMSICMNDCSVGWVSIYTDPGDKADIEYCLARKHWGQGIATQVVKMVVKMVLKEFPEIVRLGAYVYPENIGSQRVLEKNGFQNHGLRKIMFMNRLVEVIRYWLEIKVVV